MRRLNINAGAFEAWGDGRFEGFLLDRVDVAVVANDDEGLITHWNRYAEDLFGWSKQEAIGRDVRGLLVPPAHAAKAEAIFTRVRKGESWEGDAKMLRRNGTALVVHATYSPIFDRGRKAEGMVAVCIDITAAREAQRRLSTQYEISKTLADAPSLEEAVPRLLQAVCNGLRWQLGALWFVDEDDEVLRCIDVWHVADIDAQRFVDFTRRMTFQAGVGLPGRVWKEGAAAWLPDAQRDPNFPRSAVAAQEGFHAGFAFPIVSRGDTLGVVEFFSDEIRPPDDDLLRMFGSIGAQIGQFMRRTYSDAAVRESEARKTAMFESSLDSIITMDHRGRVVEFNPAAEKTFGYTRDEMLGAELAEMIIPPHLRDAHRRGLAKYLQTGEGPIIGARIEITAMRADGTTFDAELAVNRVPVGGLPLFTGYLRDITDRRKAEQERTDLLALEHEARADAERANRRLNQIQTILETAIAHLSLEDLMPEILKRIGDILHTDVGTILLVNDEDANLRVRSSIGVDDQRAREALIPVGEGIAGLVTLRREPMIVDLDEDDADTPELYEGMRSLLAVPLLIEGRSTGVLVVGAREGRRFTDEDARLLDFAADRIAIAIENASLYEREHRVAMMLQRALLPDRLPGRPGLDLAARYVPGGAGVMVGGDWYDVVSLGDDRLGIAIGDVVGRGARAASIMGQLRHSLRAFALDGARPAELLAKLNSALIDDVTSDMATIVYLELNEETGDVIYSSAGHPPPLLRRGSGNVEMLDAASGIPIGTWPDATYTEATTRLDAGDSLVLYTDGLIEERAIPIDKGLAKLAEGAAAGPRSMEGYCDMLLRHMFGEGEPDDDVAMLAVHRSTSQHETFSHSFPAHPSSVGDLRAKVQRWLESLGVHPHDTYDVTLAVTEAAANAIEHPQDSETHDFQVNGVVHADRLELEVRDHGRWREPAPSDRGRGLLLMRGLMDQIEIERLAHGTRLQMRKRVRLNA